jgi:hypothetical protein
VTGLVVNRTRRISSHQEARTISSAPKRLPAPAESFRQKLARRLARVSLLGDCPRGCGALLLAEPWRGPWSNALYCPRCHESFSPAIRNCQESYDRFDRIGHWDGIDHFMSSMIKGFIAEVPR